MPDAPSSCAHCQGRLPPACPGSHRFEDFYVRVGDRMTRHHVFPPRAHHVESTKRLSAAGAMHERQTYTRRHPVSRSREAKGTISALTNRRRAVDPTFNAARVFPLPSRALSRRNGGALRFIHGRLRCNGTNFCFRLERNFSSQVCNGGRVAAGRICLVKWVRTQGFECLKGLI